MHVVCVAGARPNFMKVKPVIDALEARDAKVTFVHTGQHYDPEMSDIFLEELNLRAPDRHLGVGSGSQAGQVAAIMSAFEPVVLDVRPDLVVVVGDVNSTLAAALVAAKVPVPLAHVEAGARSGDWSMPEEVNRVVTDRVSNYLFATAEDAADNLRAEGLAAGSIFVVGNTMIDSLLANLDRARERRVYESFDLEPKKYGVVTLHRPGNVDEEETFDKLLGALAEVARELPLVFPMHPRTRERFGARVVDELTITTPLGYLDFIGLEAEARLMLTDSGGIQEETTVLGVPCLTLRDNTERPITVTEGTNQVVGRDPDAIVNAARDALAREVSPRQPALWDGKAGERIADVLAAS